MKNTSYAIRIFFLIILAVLWTAPQSLHGSPPLTCSFTRTPSSGGAPLLVSYNVSTNGVFVGMDFGDGEWGYYQVDSHWYNNPGTYAMEGACESDDGLQSRGTGVKLVTVSGGTTGPGGIQCTNTVDDPDTEDTSADANDQGCNPFEMATDDDEYNDRTYYPNNHVYSNRRIQYTITGPAGVKTVLPAEWTDTGDPNPSYRYYYVHTGSSVPVIYGQGKYSLIGINTGGAPYTLDPPGAMQYEQNADGAGDQYYWYFDVTSSTPTVDIQCSRTGAPGTYSSVNCYSSTAYLAWTTTNATSCTASAVSSTANWTGPKALSSTGTAVEALPSGTSRTYTLTCSNGSGSTADSITVANTPPTITIGAITTPRNSVLTSSEQATGTIGGTVSGGAGAPYGISIIIRRGDGVVCNDWTGSGWTNGASCSNPATLPVVSGSNWTLSGAGIPPVSQMQSGQTYRVFYRATSGGISSAWQWTPWIQFDNTLPTRVLNSIPNPLTTRITSAGSPVGTIAGTAQDPQVSVSPAPAAMTIDRASGVARIRTAIREWTGSGGVAGGCDASNRDWTGLAWTTACTVANYDTTITPVLSTNWSTSNTPQITSMTANRWYYTYLEAIDAAGNSSGWAGQLVQYIPNTASPPTLVRAEEPDYCQVGPSINVSWVYQDTEGDPQTQAQIQVDNNAGFGSPEVDQTVTQTCSVGQRCSAFVGQGILKWNIVYRARVRTREAGAGLWSAWRAQSYCIGPTNNGEANPGCTQDPDDGENSWKSPQNQYPNGVSISNAPSKPPAGEPIQFTSAGQCYKTPPNTPDACLRWDWNFGDGTTVNEQNPTHAYASNGTYPVTLKVTDQQNGYHCAVSKNLNIQQPVPSWKEVLPR